MEDFYDLLEVSRDASTEEINRAWRRKVRRYHPDVNDDARATAQFKTLKKAHEVLSDETERAAYDRMGHRTYVKQRLDGLPTGPARPTEPRPGTAAGTDRESSADDETASGSKSSGRDRTDRRRSHRTQSEANQSTRSESERTRTAGTSSTTTTGGSSRPTGETSSSAASGASSRTTTGAGGHVGSGKTGRSGSTAASRAETTRQSRRLVTPLLYAWIGVLLAGGLYLAGLWQYLGANAAALATLRRAALADPAAAVVGSSELAGPAAVALAATPDAPLSLLFPIGVVALAVVLAAVVVTFGRGLSYLYAAGGVAPLIALAADTAVSLPDGVVLALVVLSPALATAGFLLDVGRVALTTRTPRS
ncbi:DnaJ domain-containing protein [Halobellus rufus]|uniref:DnaJ domain-containing protein n=1 Tax=Halobellus rufus TaxID=1448860 RepID=UPI00067866AD|nr:J domain-containing protein [Halobellus rufus]